MPSPLEELKCQNLSARRECGQPSVNLRRIRMKNSKNKVQKVIGKP